MGYYYMARVCSRYNARSDWLSAASRQGIIPAPVMSTGRLRIMQIRKGKYPRGYSKLDHICFNYIEIRCDTRR